MSSERLSVFPAFHKVEGRTVLVAGDGPEAAAKVRLLLETCAAIRLVSAAPSDELAGLVIANDLEHRARAFVPADLDGIMLAFAASGEMERDAAVVAAARERNIPANAVDIPHLCDFYTPALVNRAPVAVAITSTGAGPVLAQQIRGQIEALLPPRLGLLARLAQSFRPTVDQMLPHGQPRRRFWSQFFRGSIAAHALAGHPDAARRLASRLLTGADTASSGFVSLVGAGPGSVDLLTLRAQRVLQEADVIVYDALVPEAAISMGRRDARRISVAVLQDAADDDEALVLMVAGAQAGQWIVRLMLGDAVSDPQASRAAAALREARLPFELVPGVTAPTSSDAALSLAGALAA